MKKLLIALVFVTIAIQSVAQLKVDLNYRNRFEFRDGYQKLLPEGTTPAFFVSQRTRVSFGYESDKLKVRITPQDVRVWGDQTLVSATGPADNTTLDLYEGYVDLKLGKNGWVTAGRQILKYDNERFLAGRNWAQSGMAYDALLFKFKLADWNLHAGGTWNTTRENFRDNAYLRDRYKTLDFLWLNRKFNDHCSLSLLHLAAGSTLTDTTNKLYFRQTTGLYTEYRSEGLNAWADAYYQYGKINETLKAGAFLAQAEAGYKFGKFTPSVGYGYISGNKTIGAELKTDHVMNIFYGARHKYFGLMDYFTVFKTDTKDGGLTDLYFMLDYKFSKSFSIRNEGHFRGLAVTNASTPTEKSLGYENDLLVNYKFADWGMLEAGYFFIAPTDALKKLQVREDAGFPQYFYIMLTVTPTLFKQETK